MMNLETDLQRAALATTPAIGTLTAALDQFGADPAHKDVLELVSPMPRFLDGLLPDRVPVRSAHMPFMQIFQLCRTPRFMS